ncbi:tetratricopeptide repeat protein [Pedobacter sp. BAL39]|uniref:tetratricopeptide repeat protein n=1 Tax=Pedobacter sp. BAL39 TaxID=391596 RepID=UPI0002D7494C|nr:tetratricopeptide repeat protein [Pedobacter sp. BAL39]
MTVFSEPCRGQYLDDDNDNGLYDTYHFGRPDSVFLQLKKQSIKAANAGNLDEQGSALRKMGEICFHLGHYGRALEYLLDARAMFEKIKRDDLLADNFLSLGTLYFYNRDTLKSKQSFNTAMHLFKKRNNQQGIAATLGKLGHLLEKKQKYKEAFSYQQQALKVYIAINDRSGMARTFENLGSIHEDLATYDKAMSYFQSALDIYQKSGQVVPSIEVINNIGDIYRKTAQLEKAISYYFKALALSKKFNEMYQINSAYRDIAKSYNLKNNNDSAYKYAELSRSYLLKIYSIEGNKQMAFLQALNDLEKKNNEIRTLQNEKKMNVIITIATVLVIILLLLSVFLLTSRQRIKLSAERQYSKQQFEIFETQRKLMEADLKNKEMEETQLKSDIELKSKELTTQVLHVIRKNQLLESLKSQLEEMAKDDKRDQKKQFRQVIQQINQNFNNDNYWTEFRQLFEQIHHSFFDNLNRQFPGLTATDLRLISLLKMNMDSNDMAAMLAISQDSLRIARYRLRKKLNLDQGENLVSFLQSI